MQMQQTQKNLGRRLFVGDLHGCLDELNRLLDKFAFNPKTDTLFSVGDIMGKGPDVTGTLLRLQELQAQVVRGNHDEYLLTAIRKAEKERSVRDLEYMDSLGSKLEIFAEYIRRWPLFLEMDDLILVHAGLEPLNSELRQFQSELKNLADMSPRILMQIRTWDDEGIDLKKKSNPAWFECVEVAKTIIFGHWSERGLVDLPRFKGLDTGCVYGGKLTGYCPEENRFIQVKAKRVYSQIHF